LVDTESLRKILDLESKKGYTDKAVFGGLDKFLDKWSAEAAHSLKAPHLRARLKKLGLTAARYASLGSRGRRELVGDLADLLAAIDRSGNEATTSASSSEQPPRLSASSGGKRAVPERRPPGPVASLDSPITVVRGISTNLDVRFRRLGVRTVRDLLYYFPRRHLDFSQKKAVSQLTECIE